MPKKLVMFIIALMLFGVVSCSNGSGVDYPKEYNIVDVISGEETDEGVVMIIETDGFGGTLQAEVTVLDGEITAFTVEDHSESAGWGEVIIEDSGLIQALIDQSDDLDNFDIDSFLDSEASATLTSEALLDIAKVAIQHYEEDYQ